MAVADALMGAIIRWAEFTPSELSEMIGISPDLQRVWRNRRHISNSVAKHARFDTRTATALFVRHELAKCGFPPSETADIADNAAPFLVFYALMNVEGSCEVRGDPDRAERVIKAFEDHSELIEQVCGAEDYRPFLWCDNSRDLRLSDDPRQMVELQGGWAYTVLHLERMGEHIAMRSPRALLVIEFPETPGQGRPVKRLNRTRA